jgi:imidazolonepropionase-like amidohydrolase
MKNILLIILFNCSLGTIVAQVPSPGKKQEKDILLLGATAHLGNGKVIENSAVAFSNGKLVLVADARTIKIDKASYGEVYELQGKHIYPGFIAPNVTLGLSEIEAVKASVDEYEIGHFNPHIRSLIAFNTESKIIGTVRANGVLISQATPRGGRISGTSSVVQLDAWNWKDAVVKEDDGIHVNWPRMYRSSGWWAEPGGMNKNENYQKEIDELSAFFSESNAYLSLENVTEKNIVYEGMNGVFNGKKRVYFHADYVKDLIQIIAFIRKHEIKFPVIVGGYDAYLIADMIKDYNIPIILRKLHELPMRPEDDINLPYKIPSILLEKGIVFCLQNSGDMEAMNTRNLPFLAGTAAAWGVPYEEAVKSISLNAAKILGVDHILGSIEVGKHATLFVSNGDALDMKTNAVELAFIEGRKVNLDNHQIQLYEKYKEKYEK